MHNKFTLKVEETPGQPRGDSSVHARETAVFKPRVTAVFKPADSSFASPGVTGILTFECWQFSSTKDNGSSEREIPAKGTG